MWTPFLLAQTSATYFERLGRTQGLSQSTVRAISQDTRGFMWFANQNGLNRYDGIHFQRFQHDDTDPTSLVSNFTLALGSDVNGSMWVGTSAGLDYFDPVSQGFRHFSSDNSDCPISPGTVRALLVTGSGELWVGTSAGLTFLQGYGEHSRLFLAAEYPLLTSGVSSLAVGEGGVWVGTSNGDVLFHQNGSESFEPLEAFAGVNPENAPITALLMDGDRTLWVGTGGAGVVSIHLANGELEHFRNDPFQPQSIADNNLTSILLSEDGSLWFGCENQGLSKLFVAGGGFENYQHQSFNLESLSSNQVHSLFQDRGGILWVGTNNGLNKLFPNSESVRHYRSIPFDENSLSNDRVKAFWEGSGDVLWIGTYGGGLNALDLSAGQFSHYGNLPDDPHSIGSNNVFSLYQNETGKLWVGTYGGGLDLMDIETGRFQHYRKSDGQLISDKVVNVTGGPNGKMWVSTAAGVGLFDARDGSFDNVGALPGGPGTKFARLVIRGEGELWWIGTFSEGLYAYDAVKGSFKNYRNDIKDAKSLTDNNVQCLLLDHNKQLWVGTADGLEQMEPGGTSAFRHFHKADGLPGSTIYGLQQDRAYRLWITTENGLCRFDPLDMEFVNFGLRNGLQGLEFNTGAALRSSRNELILGGTNGFNIFHPSVMTTNINPPEVVLTSFKILNKEVVLPQNISLIDEVVLSHLDDVISFEFAALDFADPEKNSFAYQLVGFDSGWQEVGQRHFAGYTNLDPGSYTLRVKAANDDGVWSKHSAELRLKIIPPFYKRMWFFGFCAFFVGLLLWTWSWRNRHKQATLSRLVAERTRSLEDSNLMLKKTAENLVSTQRKLLESAHKVGMAEIASDILHNVGNSLNGIMVSANVVDKHIQELKVAKLKRVSDLLRDNQEDLPSFLSCDDKASKVVEILCRLSDDLENARDQARKEVRELHERGLEIVSILRAQRKYALGEEFYEEVELHSLLEDVLHIQSARLEELKVRVRKEYKIMPTIGLPKSKLLNVFNQVIKNSCDAMEVSINRDHRELTLGLELRADRVVVSIGDTGVGLASTDLQRIFNPGYSTKESNAGFGLHHCANSLMEIGGAIKATSPGSGMGATFFLDIPLKPVRKSGGDIV